MNGLGLLVAIATLGVDVGWETGPEGRLLYTIRIEPVLLQPLRDGQAVVSTVDANDRGLRRFQVVMGAKQGAAAGNRMAPASDPSRPETMVQHGWRTGEDGGVDYLVQMTPERLQSLANGQTLYGEVDPQVTEIRRIYVYAGVGEVPRTALPQQSTKLPDPPTFVPNSDPASPNISRPRIEAPRQNTSASNSSSGMFRDRRDAGWRDDGFNSQYAGSDPRDRDTAGWSGNFNDPRNAPGYNDPRGGGSFWPNRQEGQFYPVGYDPRAGAPPANNSQPTGATANYAQRPAADIPAPPANQPAASAAPAAAPNWQTAPASATNATSRDAGVEARPWTPLILTTLALFASLGTNAYLGWLSWSFFWRYRDAITDLARSRTSLGSSRQAA
jgi:hypothetical protein